MYPSMYVNYRGLTLSSIRFRIFFGLYRPIHGRSPNFDNRKTLSGFSAKVSVDAHPADEALYTLYMDLADGDFLTLPR